MASTRTVELASMIAEHTTNVDNFLVSKGLPTPSFDPDAPQDIIFPDSVAASQEFIVEATDELHSLILGLIGFMIHSYVSLTHTFESLKP